MAESTASLTRADIVTAVARLLDMGYRTESELSGDDLTEVQTAVKDGYRNALSPEVLPTDLARGITTPHEWSFLKPLRTLTTAASDYAYDLADDEAMILGDYISFGDTTSYPPLGKRTEGWIRIRQQQSIGNGRPEYFAVRYKDDAGTGQRLEVLLSPTPDAVYTLTYRAMLNPDVLANSEYPPGGMRHAALFKSACLAAAEFNRNSARGPMWEDYMRELTKSVLLDRKIEVPDVAGRMKSGFGDESKALRSPDLIITFNGVDRSVQEA